MSLLPRVTEKDRELVIREFDDRGPDACMREIVEHLKGHNPELLDMAARCAGDLRNPTKAMLGFGMFYRLLILAPTRTDVVIPLPRVSVETRALLVAEIDEKGSEGFTTEAIAELEISNPELLQMAHNFASRLRLPARDAGLCALVQVPPGSSKGRSGEAALRGNFVLLIRSPGTKKCSTLLQAMLALQGGTVPP
jgi:hypothetical protein